MTNDKLTSLITELYDVKRQRREIQILEESLLNAIKPLADPKFDALPDEPIVAGDLQFKRGARETRTVSADLLLERGVAPDIIAYATKTTPYFTYSVSKPKTK